MTYLGYPIVDWEVAINSVSLSLKAKTNIIGQIYQNRRLNVQQNPYALLKFTFKQDNNMERQQLRDFFIDRQGKNKQFFIRSYKNDLKLLYDTPVSSNILNVMQGYDKKAFEINGRFLYIVGHSSPYQIIGVTEGYDNILDIETVNIELDRHVEFLCEKECTLIEYLYFGRFDSDTLTFDYNDIITSSASITFREASDVEIQELINGS